MENISTEDTEDTEGTDKDEDKGKKQLLEKNLFPYRQIFGSKNSSRGFIIPILLLRTPGVPRKNSKQGLNLLDS